MPGVATNSRPCEVLWCRPECMCFQHLGLDSAFLALLGQCYMSLSLIEAKTVALASPLFVLSF